MPFKDPEKQREYQRDAMRRRRAQQKPSEELASPSGAIPGPPPPRVLQLDKGLAPTPPKIYKPLLPYIKDFKELNNRWHAHEKEQSFPCYKAQGHCCLPLEHDLPRKAVTSCVFPIPGCAYFKEGEGEE